MADFKPIMTEEEYQERFQADFQPKVEQALKDRLKRANETAAKKYEGYIAPDDFDKRVKEYEKQIKALQDAAAESEKTLAEKDAEIAKGAKYRTDLEKTRIALAAGLKIDYADRLRGENADEWKKDAETLAKDFAVSHRTAPIGSAEGVNTNAVKQSKQASERDALRSMIQGLDASAK